MKTKDFEVVERGRLPKLTVASSYHSGLVAAAKSVGLSPQVGGELRQRFESASLFAQV